MIANEILALAALLSIRLLNIDRFKGQMIELPVNDARSTLKYLNIASDILPMGSVVEYILARLTNLEELYWMARDNERWMHHFEQWWSPHDMAKVLWPLHGRLRKLDLLVTVPKHHSKLPHIEFTAFSFLVSLKIDSRMLFPWEDFYVGRNDRLGFLERLPKNLEYLHIFFDFPEEALTIDCANNEEEYWFLHVAVSAQLHTPRLMEFRIVEESYRNPRDQIQWQVPAIVQTTFDNANILLGVVLRTQ